MTNTIACQVCSQRIIMYYGIMRFFPRIPLRHGVVALVVGLSFPLSFHPEKDPLWRHRLQPVQCSEGLIELN